MKELLNFFKRGKVENQKAMEEFFSLKERLVALVKEKIPGDSDKPKVISEKIEERIGTDLAEVSNSIEYHPWRTKKAVIKRDLSSDTVCLLFLEKEQQRGNRVKHKGRLFIVAPSGELSIFKSEKVVGYQDHLPENWERLDLPWWLMPAGLNFEPLEKIEEQVKTLKDFFSWLQQ